MSPHDAAGLLFMLAGVDVEPARILDDPAVRARVVECARVNRSELRRVIRVAGEEQRRDVGGDVPAPVNTADRRLGGVHKMLDRLEEAVETVETAAEARA